MTYTVKVQRGAALLKGSLSARELSDIADYLRTLKLVGFDPNGEGWEPAAKRTYTQSAEWSVDAPERDLSPEDSNLGAHAGDALL